MNFEQENVSVVICPTFHSYDWKLKHVYDAMTNERNYI